MPWIRFRDEQRDRKIGEQEFEDVTQDEFKDGDLDAYEFEEIKDVYDE